MIHDSVLSESESMSHIRFSYETGFGVHVTGLFQAQNLKIHRARVWMFTIQYSTLTITHFMLPLLAVA